MLHACRKSCSDLQPFICPKSLHYSCRYLLVTILLCASCAQVPERFNLRQTWLGQIGKISNVLFAVILTKNPSLNE